MPLSGQKLSEETRAKQRESHKNRPPHTEEQKRKIGEANKKRIYGEEMRKKISAANFGRKKTLDEIVKTANKNTGKKRTEETKLKMSISSKAAAAQRKETILKNKSTQSKKYVLFTDVHSCADEFYNLIDKCGLNKGDILIGFSDLLDKGPKVKETFYIVKSLSKKYTVFPIIGNHDLRNHRFKQKMAKSLDDARKMKRFDELKANYDALGSDDWDFIGSMRPYFQGPDFIVVHAGIQPKFKMPDGSPPRLESMSKKEIEFWSPLWFTRYVNPVTGRFVSLGTETDQDKFWTDFYDGRYGHAYYGHQPYIGTTICESGNATGFDLGCVYGGALAAISISATGERKDYIVEAKRVYRSKDGETNE